MIFQGSVQWQSVLKSVDILYAGNADVTDLLTVIVEENEYDSKLVSSMLVQVFINKWHHIVVFVNI